MRTAKTLSISIPAAEFRKAEKLAQKENRSVEQLAAEALRIYREQRKIRKPKTFAQALELVRQDAERKGLNKLTMREINKEITAYRQEVQSKSKRKQAS